MDDQHIRDLAFKAAEYQRLGQRMPKPFVSTYVPSSGAANEKLNKNKRRKIKKKAKKKQELLEQQVKEFTSADSERLKEQESLNGLKDCNLDDDHGERDDDAEACGASADEEACEENVAGQVKMEAAKQIDQKKQQQKQQNNKQSDDPNSLTSGSTVESTTSSGETPKNGKRKELSTSNDSKSDDLGHCSNGDQPNSHNGNDSQAAANSSSSNCTATGQGNARTTKTTNSNDSPSSELMNNFSIIFEEIKQQINTAAESSTRKQRKADPSREVCSVNVKIADLGNGCWVVGIVRERRSSIGLHASSGD